MDSSGHIVLTDFGLSKEFLTSEEVSWISVVYMYACVCEEKTHDRRVLLCVCACTHMHTHLVVCIYLTF